MRKVIQFSILVSILSMVNVGQLTAQHSNSELSHLINKALDKSNALKINRLSIEQTQADRKNAKNTFLPNFTLNASYTRLNDAIRFDSNLVNLLQGTEKLLIKEAVGIPFNNAFPAGIPTSDIPPLLDQDVLKASVDMEWVLFSGFKVLNAVKATKHKEKAQEYALETTKTKTVMAVSDAYYKLGLVLASERVLKSSEKYLKVQEKFVRAAIKNGLAIPIDRQKIILATKRLEVKKLEVQNKKALVIALLYQLTGEDKSKLNSLIPVLSSFSEITIAPRKKRSEVSSLEEVIRATSYQEKMEQTNFVPKIAAKGHYELLEDDLSLLDPKWYIGVGVKWKVFDGFKAHTNRKKIRATRSKYEAQLSEAKELIALSETKYSFTLQSINKKIVMVQQEVVLAEDMYHFVTKQYRNGLTTITELMDAINEVEKSNFNLQNAFYQQRIARLNVLKAKGQL